MLRREEALTARFGWDLCDPTLGYLQAGGLIGEHRCEWDNSSFFAHHASVIELDVRDSRYSLHKGVSQRYSVGDEHIERTYE